VIELPSMTYGSELALLRSRICAALCGLHLPMANRTIATSRPFAKVGLVLGGYLVAFVVASVVVSLYVAATNGPDRQVYGAMYGFGDGLLFLAVFGIAAVPASGAALFLLRPHRSFWLALSVAALGIAATGFAALIAYVAARTADPPSVLHTWSAFAALRILVAPLFAMGFLLSGLFAPNRSSRIALLVATAVETIVFAYVALIWFRPFQAQ
jgi:hypothetical protein